MPFFGTLTMSYFPNVQYSSYIRTQLVSELEDRQIPAINITQTPNKLASAPPKGTPMDIHPRSLGVQQSKCSTLPDQALLFLIYHKTTSHIDPDPVHSRKTPEPPASSKKALIQTRIGMIAIAPQKTPFPTAVTAQY